MNEWILEPWQRFAIVLGGGVWLLYLGVVPLVSRYRGSRKSDPTHLLSYLGCIFLGLVLVVWAFLL
jgi:hypothetical protein